MLAKRKRELSVELEAVSAEIKELEEQLLHEFEASGTSNVTVDGIMCYLHRQLWAKAKEGNYLRACQALRACELGALVEEKFNSNSLSAWVREQSKAGVDLPAELSEAIEVAEVYSIRTRKAG